MSMVQRLFLCVDTGVTTTLVTTVVIEIPRSTASLDSAAVSAALDELAAALGLYRTRGPLLTATTGPAGEGQAWGPTAGRQLISTAGNTRGMGPGMCTA
jgi:hypothetical protein